MCELCDVIVIKEKLEQYGYPNKNKKKMSIDKKKIGPTNVRNLGTHMSRATHVNTAGLQRQQKSRDDAFDWTLLRLRGGWIQVCCLRMMILQNQPKKSDHFYFIQSTSLLFFQICSDKTQILNFYSEFVKISMFYEQTAQEN